MIDLSEVEVVDRDEIAEIDRKIKWLPEGGRPESPDLLLDALVRYRGAVYAVLVGQFSSISAAYLRFSAEIAKIKDTGLTPDAAATLLQPSTQVRDAIRGLLFKVESAEDKFSGESLGLVKDMASLVQKMAKMADAVVAACQSAMLAGNREYRRSVRSRKPTVGYILKAPGRRPRPKPKG